MLSFKSIRHTGAFYHSHAGRQSPGEGRGRLDPFKRMPVPRGRAMKDGWQPAISQSQETDKRRVHIISHITEQAYFVLNEGRLAEKLTASLPKQCTKLDAQ